MSFDVLSGGRYFVMRRKGIAVRTIGTRHIQDFGIAKRLLQTLAHSVIIVLSLDDSNWHTRFLIKDVIREFPFFLIAAGNVSAAVTMEPGASVTSRRIWVS